MSANKFPIGTVVAYLGHRQIQGIVIGASVRDPNIIAVEWYDGTFSQKLQSDLEAIDTELEADYVLMQLAISNAASKLNEANELALKHGKTLSSLTYGNHISIVDLFDELEEGGWSASSLSC